MYACMHACMYLCLYVCMYVRKILHDSICNICMFVAICCYLLIFLLFHAIHRILICCSSLQFVALHRPYLLLFVTVSDSVRLP